MPWKSPSSQPTSCACAIRSSDSVGVGPLNGATRRLSSSSSSGARPSLSSLIDVSSTPARRDRPASSSGAAFTSSRSWRIMLPIRITLAGCSTRSVMCCSSLSSSSCSPTCPTAIPSGPISTTRGSSELCCSEGLWEGRWEGPWEGSVMTLTLRSQQNLADMGAGVHQPMRLGDVRQRHRRVYDGPHPAVLDQRPHVLDHGRADGRLLVLGPGPQRRRDHRAALAQQHVDVELG